MIMSEIIDVTIRANVEFEYIPEDRESGQSAYYEIKSVKHLGKDVPYNTSEMDKIIDTLEELREQIIADSLKYKADMIGLDFNLDGGDVA